jgi:predicted acetyltransferase
VIELRTPTEDERRQVFDVMTVSLNLPKRWVEERGQHVNLEDFCCAYEGDRIVATAAGWRFRQWFGGATTHMTGVYAVATLPEARGTGLASEVVREVMRRGRRDGATLTALYPAALRPYRGLGYELAGTYTEHTVALA